MGGNMYDGVEISVFGDIRDLSDDLYQLKCVKKKPTNEFIFSKPTVEAPFWKDHAQYSKQQDETAVTTGRQIAVTKYSKVTGDARQQKFGLLFPSGMSLTDKHFMPMVMIQRMSCYWTRR